MISDPELQEWSELFRSDDGLQSDIAARARRAVRWFRLVLYAEVLVTVTMGGGATLWAIRSHETSGTLLAVWVWMSLAATWLFRFFNDWTDFTGATVATESYLPVLLRRLRSNLRASGFGGILFFVQLFVTSGWVFRALNQQSPITLNDFLQLPANIVFELGTVAFVLWLVHHRRRLRRKIADLEKLRAELVDEPASLPPSPPS